MTQEERDMLTYIKGQVEAAEVKELDAAAKALSMANRQNRVSGLDQPASSSSDYKGKGKAVAHGGAADNKEAGVAVAADVKEPVKATKKRNRWGWKKSGAAESEAKASDDSTTPRVLRDPNVEKEKTVINRIKKFMKGRPGSAPDRSTEGGRIMAETEIPAHTPGAGEVKLGDEIPEPVIGEGG